MILSTYFQSGGFSFSACFKYPLTQCEHEIGRSDGLIQVLCDFYVVLVDFSVSIPEFVDSFNKFGEAV
jgi:hypothetical protein